MHDELRISLLGELQVVAGGEPAELPASRKARALLAYLVATGRPHRRERLCELFWDLPDDPKAALRWALSKLRRAVDNEDKTRIVADRERVSFDTEGVAIDIRQAHACTRAQDEPMPLDRLEAIALQLDKEFLDGLDGAGSPGFDAWLVTEREDARMAQIGVLQRLATHPDVPSVAAQKKWMRLWREADPEGAEAYQQALSSGLEVVADMPQPSGGPLAGSQSATGAASQAAGKSFSKTSAGANALRAQRIGFCEVPDGTRIAYATVGSGPPILKAANWLTHLEFDWSSPIWGRSFAEIAGTRTFVRYDERGCGLSDWDVQDLSFDAFVEDLEVVADTLNLERFPLIGISQGAAVSIEYAVRRPERVSGLILVSGYAAGWRILASAEEQARREAVLTLTEVGWGTDNPAYRHIFSQTFMPDASREDLAWFDEFQRQTTSPGNAARFQDAFGHIDVRHRLAKVRAPTIVFHSRFDQRIPIEQGRELATGIPNAQFVPLESRNHILVEHEPALQTFVDGVGHFLEENGI